jgi:hypothetical protein
MEVFISWSGKRSLHVATALRQWLPMVINALKPWLSVKDIDKGARWATDVASRLSSSNAGIICLTQDNLHSDWILFEAGALSKSIEAAKVYTLLIGLETSDVDSPLSQFQATRANEGEILQLVKSLNKALGDSCLTDEHINKAFAVCWPDLKAELDKLPTDSESGKPVRSDRQLIEEILALVRNQNRPISRRDEDPDIALRRKVIRILSVLGGGPGYRIAVEGKNLKIEAVEGERGNFSVVVPRDIAMEDIESCVRAQIPSNSMLPPADAKPSSTLASDSKSSPATPDTAGP